MDAVLDAIHCLLLLHLHRVAQAQGAEEQLLVLLRRRGQTERGQRNMTLQPKKKFKNPSPRENVASPTK